MCLNHDVGDRANRCDRRRMRMMRGRRIDSAARDVRLRLRWVARNSLTVAGLHARVGSYVATDGITRNCIDRHIVVCVVLDIIILRLIHHAASPLPLLWRFPIFRCHASSRIVSCRQLSSVVIVSHRVFIVRIVDHASVTHRHLCAATEIAAFGQRFCFSITPKCAVSLMRHPCRPCNSLRADPSATEGG